MTDASIQASDQTAATDGGPAGGAPAPPATTAYYNGSCPLCRAEINTYRRYAEARDLDLGWVDIDRNRAALAAHGIDPDEAKRRLHLVDEAGRLHRGVDAFFALWRRMPRYRWLATLLDRPVLRQLAWAGYEWLLAPVIYRWDRRRLARRAQAQTTGDKAP